MYNLNKIHAIYSIAIYTISPNRSKMYNSKLSFHTKRKREFYELTLEKRFDTLIDNKIPEQVMDNLMLDLGNVLYPIEMKVDFTGKICEVINFHEIKERWYRHSEELLNKNYTIEFQKYLEFSKYNFKNESCFIVAILRDTLLEALLLPLGSEYIETNCVNFPFFSKKITYVGVRNVENGCAYQLLPAFKEESLEAVKGDLEYKKNKDGVIEYMKILYNSMDKNSQSYKKYIEIRLELDNYHTVK